MPLTDTAIRHAQPGNKARKMFDGGGLYLEVAPNGGKRWRLKYRFGRFTYSAAPETTQSRFRGNSVLISSSRLS